jgi:hypothetical protein
MKKEDAWAEIKNFADISGRRITQFEVIEGPEKGKKLYKGQIMLTVKLSDPRMQSQRMPFEFDFPEGKTFNWCRKNFDDIANTAVQEWENAQKKAQAEARKQIVPAKGVPTMLGPDGKPL